MAFESIARPIAAIAAAICVTIMIERWPFFDFLRLSVLQSSVAARLGLYEATLELVLLGALRQVHRQVVVAFAAAEFAARGYPQATVVLARLGLDFSALRSTWIARSPGEMRQSLPPYLPRT